MVSYGDVRQWKAGLLDAAEQRLKGQSDKLLGLADEFTAMGTPAGWTGEAAGAAEGKRKQIAERMEQIVAGVSAARSAIGRAADAIIGLEHGVQEADGLAQANGFAIGADGAVTLVSPETVPEAQRDEQQREQERIKAELVDRVEQILRRAGDIDNDLAGVLGKVTNGEIGDGGATALASAATAGEGQGVLSVLEPPSGKGTPGDNAGWWDTLSDAEKKHVIKNHPDWIGNRDGVPFTARDEANRARLVTEKEKLQEEARRLQADLDDNWFGGTFTNVDARLEQVKEKLASIEAIERTLDETKNPGERQLLLFDTSSERCEAAIARGNVDTADHVAVFTPGLTSNVPGSMESYDSNMEQLHHRTGDEVDKYGDKGSVATVTWIGYQAPQLTAGSIFSDNSVTMDDAAKAGAAKLTPFLQGIDTARDNDAHLTALGHSYGSTTQGFALQNNTGVDDAVFFGSPGIGTDHLDDIKVPDGHSTYIEAKWDGVGDFGAFGMDPSHLDGMNYGSSAEATLPDGRKLNEVTGHTSYLVNDSTSQYNMSVIVGGMQERQVVGSNRGAGDVGSWPIPGTY